MPLRSSRRAAQKKEGFAGELQVLGDLASYQMVQSAKGIADAAGPPWSARHLSEEEQRAKMDEYDQPGAGGDELKKMTDGQLSRAIISSVQKRQKWISEGSWSPEVRPDAPLYTQPGGLSPPLPPPGEAPPG